MDKLIAYFKSSYAELHKVSWPTKTQTTNYSLVVIGLAVGLAVFFAALDYVLNLGLESIIK